jgi:hypothetical protein
MKKQGLAEYMPYPAPRVEGRIGILKDHLDILILFSTALSA